MLKTLEEIKSFFDKDVARRYHGGLSKNHAILAASMQILRDIQGGEIDREEGVKFVATEFARFGFAHAAAASHIERFLSGEATSLPPLNMYAGYEKYGDGSFRAPEGEYDPTLSKPGKRA